MARYAPKEKTAYLLDLPLNCPDVRREEDTIECAN